MLRGVCLFVTRISILTPVVLVMFRHITYCFVTKNVTLTEV